MADLRPHEIDAAFAPARSSAVHTVELDGEAVLLDTVANRLHLLNHTATVLWARYDGRTTIAELADEIGREVDAPAGMVLADLLDGTRRLGDEGLVEGVAAEPADAADLG